MATRPNGALAAPSRIPPIPLVGRTTPAYPLCDLGGGITAQIIEEITPAMCREWLAEPGDAQRPMSRGQINMIGADIEAGRWYFNAQPFIFDDSQPRPKLLDGRHRSHSVILVDRPVKGLVIWGMSTDAFYTMDQTKARTRQDALGAMGYEDARTLGSAAQILWNYLNGKPLRGNTATKLSPIGSIEIVQKYPGLVGAMERGKPGTKIFRSAGIPVFCNYVLSQIDDEAAEMFFHRLVTGEKLDGGDPILLLRNRFIDHKLKQEEVIHLVFKAWNLFRTGKKRMSLAVKPNEEFPQPI